MPVQPSWKQAVAQEKTHPSNRDIMTRPRLLVVDDEASILDLLDGVLRQAGYDVVAAKSGAEALGCLRTQLFDAAVVDIRMPKMTGLELLHEIKRFDPSIEVLMMTAHPEVQTAIEALKAGAFDYLQKPLKLDELHHRLSRMMERRRLHGEVKSLRHRLGEEITVKELLGVSPQMVAVKEMIARVAGSDTVVLIEGESGTGKELVAGAIHRHSQRKRGPFIPVDCGAIPSDLLESEFFGHVRGAFSGAVADTEGLFRSAQGGTLFLDEVGEIPLGLQAKLLRVLQEKELRPVGSTKSYAVDCRVIAATNRNLEQAVKNGVFRQDLFYRLNVVGIMVPPLRTHKEDIPLLITHGIRRLNARFGRTVREVTPEALAVLMAHDFPGNVRELENILERAFALGATTLITAADFPNLAADGTSPPPHEVLPTLRDMERELIARALRLHHADREKAARALGMSPRTLYRRLKEFKIS